MKNEVSFNMIKEYSEKTAVLQEKVEELEVSKLGFRKSRRSTSRPTKSKTGRRTAGWQ